MTWPSLHSLGPRLMVCGPSNSGKSTLAVAIGRSTGWPVVHLDQLHHLPNTDWVPRNREEFVRLHDEATLGSAWVIEGNYMGLSAQRLARATGIVLLGSEPWRAAARNLRRTLFEPDRPGMLEGARDRLKLDFFRFILLEQPRKRARDLAILQASGLPLVTLSGMAELRGLHAAWGLARSA